MALKGELDQPDSRGCVMQTDAQSTGSGAGIVTGRCERCRITIDSIYTGQGTAKKLAQSAKKD